MVEFGYKYATLLLLCAVWHSVVFILIFEYAVEEQKKFIVVSFCCCRVCVVVIVVDCSFGGRVGKCRCG